MITLVHENLTNKIYLTPKQPNVLVIEEPIFYRNFVQQLIDSINGSDNQIIFSKNYDIYKQDGSIILIKDYFDFDYNNKKIINTLYKQLNMKILRDIYGANEIYQKGYAYIDNLIKEYETRFVLNEDLDIQNFIKLFNPTIENNSKSLIERIINMINLNLEFFQLNLIIFIDLESYFTKEEVEQIISHCKYKAVSVLLLQSIKKYDLFDEKVLIVDNDLCEI